MQLFLRQSALASLVQPINNLIQEIPIGCKGWKIRRPPYLDSLLDPVFERTMGIFYGTVLMTDTWVIHRRFHAIVLTQRFISLREFPFLGRVDVSGTETIRTMFGGDSAKFMQGILQTIDVSNESTIAVSSCRGASANGVPPGSSVRMPASCDLH